MVDCLGSDDHDCRAGATVTEHFLVAIEPERQDSSTDSRLLVTRTTLRLLVTRTALRLLVTRTACQSQLHTHIHHLDGILDAHVRET